MNLEESLKKYFGYNEFRHSQKEIISAILNKQDVLAILPTGAGKSICYQLPALLMEGIAVVVSPLISLMQDQVVSLSKNNLPAAFLNSSLYSTDIQTLLNDLSLYKLLYVAPERLSDQNLIQALQKTTVSFFAIDEAHCISQWGHSFRPEYRQLSPLKALFPTSPFVALTATATPDVEKDIATQLVMKNPLIIKASFDRPNLTIRIRQRSDQYSQIRQFLKRHKGESGIIYSSTRKGVDEIHAKLQEEDYSPLKYHAGMSTAEREKAQHAFVHGQTDLMVATIAFGMGIHKPDVRFIIHVNMPRTIEQYYQEIGRAGRDGLPAECLMLYSRQDLDIYELFCEDIEDEGVRALTRAKTEKMYFLCTSSTCRRRRLLRYFDEPKVSAECNNCDFCLDESELVDQTIAAQKILSCVYRLEQRFGIKYVTDVLRGSKNQVLLDRGHDKLSTYGLMKNESEQFVFSLIDTLIDKELLQRTKGEYPVLQWTSKSKEVTSGAIEVLIRKKHEKHIVIETKEHDVALFDQLSQLRRQISKEENVPAFVVFGDRVLIEMAKHCPKTPEALLSISGVGPIKLEKYGKQFLQILQAQA